MNEPINLYGMIMPLPTDKNNYEICELFEPIVLVRMNSKTAITCKITIQAGVHPGASISCETCRDGEKPKRKSVNFPSVDTAVIEAGRLAHTKMCQGYIHSKH